MDKRAQWLISGSVLGLVLFGPGAWQWITLSVQEHQLDRRLSTIASEHARLTALQERLQHDPSYVEGIIRTTFKVSQPGEYVVPIGDPSALPHRWSERR